MKKIKKLFYICLTFVFAASCTRSTLSFTDAEIEIINKYPQQKMRLLIYNDKNDSLILRQQTKEFSNSDLQSDIFKNLKAQMLLTVQDTANAGVGIAAPQVGVSRRLIAVQRFDKADEPFEFYANAYIVYYSDDKRTGSEGCLSIPDRRGNVERSETVVVKYIDTETLKPHTDTVSGFTAVIFQHEVDHLDGILYIDKLQPDA
ncbi:MAG: peptide deformylase [Prevotellaceae bacterium]|jgi:peptide deformylase|nr:peptide deformylase [Prevotellaceae bacterium]